MVPRPARRFKCPKHFVFAALPRTSTGKIQKFILRDGAKRPANAEERA